ncbi:MAG TPA: hypothetical protein DEE98_01185 [Elusimicrobia bacterium]|nr:MAG: hypothetical protein A2204_07900 [Elusimicrobia bacterium RIFOXYA1_FULL_47_7]HBU68976.1 hypothetical protein [Elusimicrobiota bacterium]
MPKYRKTRNFTTKTYGLAKITENLKLEIRCKTDPLCQNTGKTRNFTAKTYGLAKITENRKT